MARNNKDDKYSALDVFKYNYENVPGFKEAFKLFMYFIFIVLFMIMVAVARNSNDDSEVEPSDTISTSVVSGEHLTYKQMLDNLYKKETTINMTINNSGAITTIDAKNKNSVLEGYLESSTSTKHFKIENNTVYEINAGNVSINPELLNGIEYNFIVPANLVNILENNNSTKNVQDAITSYTYESINVDEVIYTIKVNVISNNIKEINITNENITYTIEYK